MTLEARFIEEDYIASMAAAASSTGAAVAAGGGGGSNANASTATPQQFYQLYRRSSIGMSLTDALDELIESGHIAPHLARKVVEEVRLYLY